jgi:hypothetical protein
MNDDAESEGFQDMANETWLDSNSHYMATGAVDYSGRMTDAEVTDNNGTTKDRKRTFDSQADFCA